MMVTYFFPARSALRIDLRQSPRMSTFMWLYLLKNLFAFKIIIIKLKFKMSNQEKVVKSMKMYLKEANKYEKVNPRLSYYIFVYIVKTLSKHSNKLKEANKPFD